jgi:NADH-quinone oxidoreductase subunit H
MGLGQPFADVLKLMLKEIVIPSSSSKFLFMLAPLLALIPALCTWAVMPLWPGFTVANVNAGLLYILALTSTGVYGIILAGWASNSKYPFLGALRSAAQMVSYEVSIGFVMVTVLLCVGSLNINDIVKAQHSIWFCIPLLPMFVVFFISALAETNRPPFDLPEAESELVAGYFSEYSAFTFALFFLGEYANIWLMSSMTAILFLGGWQPIFGWEPFTSPVLTGIWQALWFAGKIAFVAFCFLWVRATFPRYRYDQLMRLGWKVFLPLSLAMVVFYSAVLVYGPFDWLPNAVGNNAAAPAATTGASQ